MYEILLGCSMRLILFCLLFMCTLHAEETPDTALFVLPVGSVHVGDLFACGKSVEISGTVEGDLYVCGEQVVIDGHVTGDVLGLGGSIDIAGSVGQGARLVAGSVLISGTIHKNLSIVA